MFFGIAKVVQCKIAQRQVASRDGHVSGVAQMHAHVHVQFGRAPLQLHKRLIRSVYPCVLFAAHYFV